MQRRCHHSEFTQPEKDYRYVGFKPLTLEHVGPEPVTVHSQGELKRLLKQRGLVSPMFSD